MSEIQPNPNNIQHQKVARMLTRFVSEHIILEYPNSNRNLIIPKEEVRLAGLYDVENPDDVDREVITDLLLDAINPSLN